MAEMIPLRTEHDLEQLAEKNSAEAKVYRALRELSDSWTVFHGLRTLLIEEGVGVRDREADFVVLHPRRGLLVIEVKGGRVSQKDGRWIRTRKSGDTETIKDPFAQASEFKYALLKRLHQRPQWDEVEASSDGARETARHAVLLPDVRDVSAVRGLHIEQEVIGGFAALGDLEAWMERVFRFGEASETRAPLGSRGVEIARDILCEPFSTDAILGFDLDLAEERRLVLTHEQFVGARRLRTAPALAVGGGAGTGKTVLAFRRARQSAAAGLRTLLLCYNRPLADSLGHERQRLVSRGEVLEEHLIVNTIDGFSMWIVGRTRSKTGEDYIAIAREDHPTLHDESALNAIAMEYALEDHPLEHAFDVILIDEGQDFGDNHWRALQGLLRGARWCIFFDPDQTIYRRAAQSPVLASTTEQLRLTRNCRNTDRVHAMAYRFYRGSPPVEAASLEGHDVCILQAPNIPGHAKRIVSALCHWIQDEGVSPGRIAVLALCAPRKREAWAALDTAANRRKLVLKYESHGHRDAVLFDTVRRFKGLEADIVVLWFNGPVPLDEEDSLRYVGCSRAKTLLALVGTSRDLDAMS